MVTFRIMSTRWSFSIIIIIIIIIITKWLRIRNPVPHAPIIPRLLLLPLKYGGRAYVVVIFGLKVEDAFDAALHIIVVPRCSRKLGI